MEKQGWLTSSVLGPVALAMGLAISANATSITFTFDPTSGPAPVVGSSKTDSTVIPSLQAYMDAVLGCTNCVTVVGSVFVDRGANQATQTNNTQVGYNGDGHVVGPNGKPLTLGNTDGAVSASLPSSPDASPDNYLRNIGGETAPDNQIELAFSGIEVTQISFDFEIFPDNSCTTNGCTPKPDFTVSAGNANPPTNPLWSTSALDVSSGNTTYTKSLLSSSEGAPQLLGHWDSSSLYSTGLNGGAGYNTFSFIDWPAIVGIDNLQITYSKTPEPGSIVLLGIALSGLLLIKRLSRS